MTACVSEPISWLRLERYALGETLADRDGIAEHLAGCATCRACLQRIEDEAARALPPLPPLPAARGGVRVTHPPWRLAAIASASVLALAAGIALVLSRDAVGPGGGGRDRVKGTAVAFSLVRDDDAVIAEAWGSFHDGDRFKAVVTCEPGSRAHFDLVVFDEGAASFPLSTPNELACGNDVPLAGAFRLRGVGPLRVCLVWSDDPPDRAALARAGAVNDRAPTDRPGLHAACKVLQAADGSSRDPQQDQ